MSESPITRKISRKMSSCPARPTLICLHPDDMARLQHEFAGSYNAFIDIDSLSRDVVRFRGVKVVRDFSVSEGSPVVIHKETSKRRKMIYGG